MDAPENYDIQDVLESKTWTFAKTMPHNPHYWSARQDWDSPEAFYEAANHIYDNGHSKMFGRTEYKVFYLGGWRYWTMSKPYEKTRIINRAVIDETDPPEFRVAGDSATV
jgi:hypothetical protein